MGKWKRRLQVDPEWDFKTKAEGGAERKRLLRCCPCALDVSPHLPHWFIDKHYPEDNGFYYNYFGNAVGGRWQYCPFCGHQIEYERFADVQVHPEEVGKER